MHCQLHCIIVSFFPKNKYPSTSASKKSTGPSEDSWGEEFAPVEGGLATASQYNWGGGDKEEEFFSSLITTNKVSLLSSYHQQVILSSHLSFPWAVRNGHSSWQSSSLRSVLSKLVLHSMVRPLLYVCQPVFSVSTLGWHQQPSSILVLRRVTW